MNTLENSIIQFELPAHLSCPQPTEERGLLRDEVRLMITTGSATVHHSTFDKVDEHLQSGDVLVVNTSATVPAALPVTLSPGRIGVAHFSTHLDKNEWLVEIREVTGNKTIRWKDGKEGMIFYLPEDAALILKKDFTIISSG